MKGKNMKIKKSIIAGCIIFAAYTVGRIAGHNECLHNVAAKYGAELFVNRDSITDNIYRDITIAVHKSGK